MNELTPMNFNGVDVIDSQQVAEAVGKEHSKLLRDIRRYSEYLTEAKIGFSDFFIESSYTDPTGRTLPCYLCTRKGCEMIANKLTGQKGVVFTALYINAFHKMEKQYNQQAPVTPLYADTLLMLNQKQTELESLVASLKGDYDARMEKLENDLKEKAVIATEYFETESGHCRLEIGFQVPHKQKKAGRRWVGKDDD